MGRGSTFHFTARFGVGSGAGQAAAAVAAEILRQVPVLIVDDNATNRLILEETVRHWDMEPLMAASGREALDVFDRRQAWERPIRLLLTDVHMPEMDGYMLCERIRQRPGGAGMAIIALTSGDRHGDADLAQRLGLAAQLIKPVKPSELRQVIGTVLAAARSRRPAGERTSANSAGRSSHRPGRCASCWPRTACLNQKLAVGLLTKWGHTVTVANNGREAVVGRNPAAVRPGADGHPDARDERFRGHRGDPPTGTRARRACAHRGRDRPRAQGRPRALPGGRHGRLRLQADPAGRVVPSHPACCPHHV